LEDWVYFFIERETYRWQKLNEGIKKVDKELEVGFNDENSKEDPSPASDKARAVRIEKFWSDIKTFIVERLCKKIINKRDNVSAEKLKDWIESREPDLTFTDLSDYNKKRIENEEVFQHFGANDQFNTNASKTSVVFSSSKLFNMHESSKPIYDIARNEMWKPIVWLHQKQLIDDFIFFTILSELCTSHGEQIAFNIKQSFVQFITSNMPVLLTLDGIKSKKYTSICRREKNWEQPLDIGWKVNTQLKALMEGEEAGMENSPQKAKDNFKSKEWKYLYKNPYDKILLPIVVNNHPEHCKLHVGWGSDINKPDFQGWTSLHWAAYSGNIDILKYLLEINQIDIEAEDDEGRTPLLVAIETGNVLGNENATSVLLEYGAQLDKDLWDKLLILSVDHDLIVYPRIALKNGTLSLKFKGEERFSLHKVVKSTARNLLQFLIQNVDEKHLK